MDTRIIFPFIIFTSFCHSTKAQEPYQPRNLCELPPSLGYSGLGTRVEDCTTLKDFENEIPCQPYSFTGSSIKICCPFKKKIIFPDHPIFSEQKDSFYDDYLEYDCYDGQDQLNQIKSLEANCNTIEGTSCVRKSECSIRDFNGPTPPITCGFDFETGEDKVCCAGPPESGPRSLSLSKRKYDCIDHSKECPRFLAIEPDSCKPGSRGYLFMRYACMATCGRCGKGECLDEYENCPKWAGGGLCSVYPEFMIFACRESCGTCGFKSAFSSETQTVDGRQYSDMTRPNFHCGEGKPRKDSNFTTNFNQAHTFNGNASCTTMLINDRFLLTAAHCTLDINNAEDSVGEVIPVIVIRDNTPYREVIEVKRTFEHPLYQGANATYDIAILELERRVSFDFDKYGDAPACLDDGKTNYTGQSALSQGYGLTEKNTQPPHALEANVTVISHKECFQMLLDILINRESERTAILVAFPQGLTKQTICTKGIFNEEKGLYTGLCPGDSGSPGYIGGTISKNHGGYVGQKLLYIHAGGQGCGTRPGPHWHNRVSSYAPWINCVIRRSKANLAKESIERQCRQFVELPQPVFDLRDAFLKRINETGLTR